MHSHPRPKYGGASLAPSEAGHMACVLEAPDSSRDPLVGITCGAFAARALRLRPARQVRPAGTVRGYARAGFGGARPRGGGALLCVEKRC